MLESGFDGAKAVATFLVMALDRVVDTAVDDVVVITSVVVVMVVVKVVVVPCVVVVVSSSPKLFLLH